jgi:oligopeptidase B
MSKPCRRSITPTALLLLSAAVAICAGCWAFATDISPVPNRDFGTVLLPPVAVKKPFDVPSPNGLREDDYYWLRDDTRTSNDVLSYLARENAYTQAQLKPTQALQDKLYTELVGRLKQDDRSVPVFDKGYWYYSRFETGQQYPIYARKRGNMTAAEQILLDEPKLALGHDFFQVAGSQVSPDSNLLAYAEDTVGRRQYTLKIKDLRTGAQLPDTIANVEPDLVWAADNKTLLYIEKDPVTLLSVRVHQHVLGTDPKQDTLVYEEKDPSFYLGLGKSKSERYLFIVAHSTLVSEWRYAAAADPHLQFKPVLPREANHEYEVEQVGKDFIVRTNWNAANFRIMRAPIASSTDKRTWRDIVAHRSSAFIADYSVFKHYLAISERSDGLMKVRLRSWDGKLDKLLATDEPAYTMRLIETPGFSSNRLRYNYTSLTTPATTYEFNMATGRRSLLKVTPVLGGFDAANYKTEYLHAVARDGVQIPISIVYRKDTPRDGTAPLYQYGYGSYGISTDPEFHMNWLSLLDRGFVVAIAHVRGGQEMGRAWYETGKLLYKRNTFTDFIAATEFLVKQKYGAKDRVFAQGGSAGGLLMGAIANLAPQDYRGIIANVPFVDVVTTMLDDSIPLTTNEFDEWGNPKDKQFYDYMLSYSPYDNVRAQAYPAMFVSTGLWDSQVQYYEPAKWVAKLRALKTNSSPLLLRINMEAGHGGKSGRFERLRETAMEYQFILTQLDIKQ